MPGRKVTGSFDLSTGPATSALRDLDRAIDVTDANLAQLGRRMDEVVSTKNLTELDDYKHKLDDIGRTRATPEINLKGADEADVKIDDLNRKLDDLGSQTAKPRIDLKGFDAAIAKAELLQKRLDALGRQTSRPRVAVGGGAGMVARDVASAASGGGGGGGFGGLGGYGGMGKWGLLGGGILSAASPVSGGALALVGSAGEGLLGLGGLGITAGGVASVGFGSIIPTAVMATSSLKKASKALANYDKQVEISGIHSKQAKTAYAELNQVLSQAPQGTRRMLREYQGLRADWMRLSKPGQQSLTEIGATAFGTARHLAPQFAGIGNEILGQANIQAGNFGQFLEDPRSRNFYRAMGAEATRDLTLLRGTGESVLSTMENIAVAGRPFFHEAVQFIDHWTGGWKEGTSDLGHTREELGKFDEQLKHWGSLTGAGYELIRDLLSPAAAPGGSMVVSLTHTLESWDRWINANPAKVRAFYRESVQTVDHVAEALGHISKVLWNLGQLLTPILNDVSQFTSFAAQTGLLSSGGLPFLLAGGAGIRNAQSNWSKRIKGISTAEQASFMGAVPIMGAAGAPARGAVGSRAVPGVYSYGGSGEMYALLGASAFPGERTGVFPRKVPFERIPLGKAAGIGFGDTYSLARQMGYSRFAAARAEMGSYLPTSVTEGATMVGSDIMRGAASRFLPVAALMGGLGVAGFQGNLRQRLEAGISQATVGLFPMPHTGAEEEDVASRRAALVAQSYARRYGGSILGLRRERERLTRKRAEVLVPTEESSFLGIRTPTLSMPSSVGDFIEHGFNLQTHAPFVVSQAQSEEAAKLAEQQKAVARGINAQQMRRGQELASGFQKGLAIDLHEGTSPFKVLEKGQGLLLSHLSVNHLGREGSARLADSMLSWARTMKEKNPQLTQAVEEFTSEVESHFKKMGINVEVVNGHIVEGTKAEWDRISKVISSASFQALESTSKAFKGIEREALSALRGMGFSPQEARNLFKLSQTNPKLASEASPKEAKPGFVGPRIGQVGEGKGHHARGGRLPWNGSLHDVIPLGGNQWGAGGELMVNQHTERRADMLLAAHGTSLSALVGGEGFPHSADPVLAGMGKRFAMGGRVILDPGVNMSVGEEPQILRDLRALSAELHQAVYVISGYRSPAHSVSVGGFSNDPHTRGEAADIGVGSPTLDSMFGVSEAALRRVGLYRPFYPESAHEVNHVQLLNAALARRLGPQGHGGTARMGGRAGAIQQINLQAPHVRGGGALGAAVDAASHGYAAGLQQHINRALARRGGLTSGLSAGHGFGGSRSAVERAIATDLFRHGANRIGAAGIIGNAYAESSMDPTAEGTGGGGLWGFTSGAISLANLKRAGGGGWGDPTFQTNFMLAHGGSGLIPALNRARTPEESARLFMEQWERPGSPRLNVREAGARYAYQQGFARGGRLPGFAGWYGAGGRGIADRPALLGVGDKPEEVHIRPLHAQRPIRRQQPIIQVKVDLRGAHIQGKAHAKKIAKEMAEQVSAELVLALNNNDGVPEEDLTG